MSSTHLDCWFGEPCAAGLPAECPKEIAAAKREKGQPWSALELRRESGGLRHYLDGEPVHCGDVLELQAIGYRSDDYGEYIVSLQRGSAVRYEASWRSGDLLATLHAAVGGREFVASVTDGMRFRWPGGSR